ncbi:hypothetical protein [Kibdelosporangium philippinense]|uniref:hypothetical protein n=1 Tax=Kibdelosporangium philippinense TaxID=211113 RepID=UPI00360CF2C3
MKGLLVTALASRPVVLLRLALGLTNSADAAARYSGLSSSPTYMANVAFQPQPVLAML